MESVAALAGSAVVLGEVWLGAGVSIGHGVVVRAHDRAVQIGHHSVVRENATVWGDARHPVRIGRRTVVGHRVSVSGARVGDLCEIGTGSILLPGSWLGDGCILAEGTVIPAGMVVPAGTVLAGRPPHAVRSATDADRARLARLRGHRTGLTDHGYQRLAARPVSGATMGHLYAYDGKRPWVHESAVLFDSAEVTGDVEIGPDCVLAAGVKIAADGGGPIRLGRNVQILENAVLHLLPDEELVVEDDVVIGPGALVHGGRIGAHSVIESGAIVCDGARLGPGTLVRAGACVRQRSAFGPLAVLDGIPARVTDVLDGRPSRPPWAFTPTTLAAVTKY
ncbi:gamma carbonic anhydrase family protein [Actinocatenispora rupis]|uniref:Carbonic anhydrase or acetyltransferase, isoleucine patch superfamily n=1 Tax=Actinocatenispora rupis TaxID=519421 RepID=A0A8J3IYW9_9ACTN|nr:DapH/DapD/GlmU-related protein [Actinocatenispora rupis]GID11183.1 hypothetical protein Aru02nite_20720 [Actinocatenispora rupis]